MALPVVLRLCWGVSDLASPAALTPAQAERTPANTAVARRRFIASTTIGTARRRNVTGWFETF
jgi:uncharacterized membrane protein